MTSRAYHDMKFVAGDYLYGDLPIGKEYLHQYFDGPSEVAFLSYYFIFSDMYEFGNLQPFYQNFCDHTGICCSARWVRKLLLRLSKIEKALKAAEDMPIDESMYHVSEIRSGKALF